MAKRGKKVGSKAPTHFANGVLRDIRNSATPKDEALVAEVLRTLEDAKTSGKLEATNKVRIPERRIQKFISSQT